MSWSIYKMGEAEKVLAAVEEWKPFSDTESAKRAKILIREQLTAAIDTSKADALAAQHPSDAGQEPPRKPVYVKLEACGHQGNGMFEFKVNIQPFDLLV